MVLPELFGEDQRTVQRWVKLFESHGLEGVREGDPDWVSGCASPYPKWPRSDPVKVTAVIKLRRLARRRDIELWSLDECHFQQHGTRCRIWVSPEVIDPVLMHAPTRKSVACFGAVNLSTGKVIRAMCEKFDAVTFEAFLKKLLRHRSRGKRMVVVLDNARSHHALLLKPLLRKYRAILTLLFLPPCSPQLAPMQRVWKLARRIATHNRFFATLGELLAAIEKRFDRWRQSNSVLRRLCGFI